jgi:hypothetical protein
LSGVFYDTKVIADNRIALLQEKTVVGDGADGFIYDADDFALRGKNAFCFEGRGEIPSSRSDLILDLSVGLKIGGFRRVVGNLGQFGGSLLFERRRVDAAGSDQTTFVDTGSAGDCFTDEFCLLARC